MKKTWLYGLLVWLLAVFVSLPIYSQDWLYTVRKGDSARVIANKYLINPYRIDEVLLYNQLSPSEPLVAGSVLKFPLDSLKFGPARVIVLSVQGEVSLHRAKTIEALSTATSIQLGDKIITADNAYTSLRFADKSELLLGSNSELVFDVLTRWGRTGMVDSRMRLLRGNVEGRIETLQGPGAHFEVHTPSAVATVRGTEFRVRVDGDNTSVSYNEVSEGKVRVQNKISEELVPQGFGLVSEAGKAADKPVELLAAPSLIAPADKFPGHPVAFDWSDNPSATGYRVELFAGDVAEQQLQSFKVANSQVQLQTLTPGNYTIRLRAIDTKGLEGLDRSHSFQLSGAPLAPTQLNNQATFLVAEPLSFNWQASESADNYQLELSNKSDFSDLLAKETINVTKVSLDNSLTPGSYYWRVNASNDEGQGYYSEVKSFTVNLPEAPRLDSISDVEVGTNVIATWSQVPYVDNYQWQLASDENFEDLVEQGQSQATQVNLANLTEGDYFFRVSAQSSKNKDRFSQVQNFEVYQEGNGKNPFMLSSLLLVLLIL